MRVEEFFPAAWRPQLRALLPLYAAGYVAMLCPFLALGSVLDDDRFQSLTLFLITAGFAVSLLARLAGVPRRAAPTLLGAAIAALLAIGRAGPGGAWLPGASNIIAQILPAIVLGWFLVVFSFCLLDDDLLLFIIPPSLTILGLCGTENPNADMTGYFLVFVVASIFALCYHNYLRYVPAAQAGRTAEALRPVLRWQIVSAAILFVLVAILTAVVATPLKRAGRMDAHRFGLPGAGILGALGAMGYNAMGREIEIGQGSPAVSGREVFRVESTGSAYWRAHTYDNYTGRGWTDSSSNGMLLVTELPQEGGWQALVSLEPPADQYNRSLWHEVRQKIAFTASWPSRSLPAAAEVGTITFAYPPGWVRVSPAGDLVMSQSPIQAGSKYEVVSRVLEASPAVLRRVPNADPEDPDLADYLRVPNSVWRVQAEAERVTAGLKGNYDRAAAIAAYLSSNYVYNLGVPPVPKEEDVVTHFLLTAREGYCDLFASAMVVMCRSVGIPARLATGFATGTYDEGARAYIVREMDAHAWVEIYFPRVGWVQFDPTPAAREEMLAQLGKGGARYFFRRLTRLVTFPALLLLGVVGLSLHLARLTLFDPWQRRRALMRSAGSDARGQVLRAYYTAYSELRRKVRRKPYETPVEYYHAVARRAAGAPWLADLDALTHAFLAARFGDHPISEDEAGLAGTRVARVVAGARAKWDAKRDA